MAALRFTALPEPERLPKGLDALHHATRGWWRRRRPTTARLLAEVRATDAFAAEFGGFSHAALRHELADLRRAYRRTRAAPRAELEARTLAALRETAERAWGLRPYDVQLAGVLGLSRGLLIEMATGEGKTLVAALAAVLAGWRGRPCHVVTVNDYLAQRDAASFARIAKWVGLEVAAVTAPMTPPQRQIAYRADVVYTTSKELLADFLRDRLTLGNAGSPDRLALRQLREGRPVQARLVLRGLHTAIVDEADSVLIDDAVTPLIISRPEPNEDLRQACLVAHHLAQGLEPERHYRVDPSRRRVDLTRRGERRLREMADALPALWRGEDRRRELVERALEAKAFFFRDQQYVLDDGKVTIVDEMSGRLMPQRTWREGLHQAIEAREEVPVTSPSVTLARMSFQRFFRLFPRLSGMTGTAREAAGEFWQIYRLTVVRIPTHRPTVRQVWRPRYTWSAERKWEALEAEIARVHGTGRPILVGTRSIEESELLAARLAARGLFARVLNARRHAEEAAIISGAGEPGSIVIATNMAGRGTDIRLARGVVARGGLHVVATTRNASGRIDRQLLGRAGRQGDPGSGRLLASADDTLLEKALPPPLRLLLRRLGTASPALGEVLLRPAFGLAQVLSDRRAYRQRKGVLRNDQWLEDSLGFAGDKRE